MTRPMSEGERQHALLLAQQTAEWAPHSSVAEHILARALLSTSASERALREALERMVEHFDVWAKDHVDEATAETWAALHCARAALSHKGEDELARGLGRSE